MKYVVMGAGGDVHFLTESEARDQGWCCYECGVTILPVEIHICPLLRCGKQVEEHDERG